MRVFVAIDIDRGIRDNCRKIMGSLEESGADLNIVSLENLHITLKFLGEIDEQKRVEMGPVITGIGEKHSPFPVRLQGLGCFPNPRNPRVLWVGVEQGNVELCNIAEELEKGLCRLGFKEEKRFHPHLTIGRIKKFCKIDGILAKNISTDAFDVASVVLFKSTLKPDGPVYEELDRFALP